MSNDKANKFTLIRATPDDIPEIVDLQYDCFTPYIREVFMGCKSRDDLHKVRSGFVQEMKNDPFDIWVKVTNKANGKIVAASNWKLYPNNRPEGAGEDKPSEWLEGDQLEQSRKVLEGQNEVRRKCMPGPFLHLHICFTSPDYRRQGAGRMMMQWGCDLADQLYLPGYIEASPEGNFLYKSAPFHFYDYASLWGELRGTVMKRDARKSPIEGGKEG